MRKIRRQLTDIIGLGDHADKPVIRVGGHRRIVAIAARHRQARIAVDGEDAARRLSSSSMITT
jgi:hypothetical protein